MVRGRGGARRRRAGIAKDRRRGSTGWNRLGGLESGEAVTGRRRKVRKLMRDDAKDVCRARPVRVHPEGPQRRGLRVAEPDPGAGDPVGARRQGRDRPGADGDRQDGGVRPADRRVHRSRGLRGAGAGADADARALHPGHAGAAHVRRAQGDRRRRGLRRRADPHPAGAAARRRARRRRDRRPRARPDLAPLAGAARLPLRGARRGR